MRNVIQPKRKDLEKPMVHKYWNGLKGGTLIRQFEMVKRSASCGRRVADALIILGGEHRELRGEYKPEDVVKGKRVVVVQAKTGRLGMYLMGQGVFSVGLMKRLKPKSVKSVMLCNQGDEALEPLLARFGNVEAKVM
jgi:hypothetical protein